MAINSIPAGYQARYGTSYTVTFPDFPTFKTKPYEIELHQAIKTHDILILKFQISTPLFFKGFKTGTTVQVNWTNSAPAKGVFTGYISTVKKSKKSPVNSDVEITCIGGSFPLKNQDSNIWKKKSIPEVVQEIAKKTKMKAIVTSHPTKWSQLNQHGSSYWEYLVTLATSLGYALWVKGTTIYFKSIDDVLTKSIGTTPILYFENQFAPPFHAPIERTLDYFEPTSGDFIEGEGVTPRRTQQVNGVNPVTGKMYGSVQTPQTKKTMKSKFNQVLFEDHGAMKVTNSADNAKLLAMGAAENARLTNLAWWSGQGDPRMTPYGAVDVQGIDDINDGIWLVRSATHVMSKTGTYTCAGYLMCEGSGPAESTNQRVSGIGLIPALNLIDLEDGDSLGVPATPTLSSPTSMFSETESGYTLNSRRWVG